VVFCFLPAIPMKRKRTMITTSLGYDSLKLSLPIPEGDQVRIASRPGLQFVKETSYANGNRVIESMLDNLKIRIGRKRLTIENSFAKYGHVNNVNTLRPEDLNSVLNELEHVLDCKLRWATVRRLDVAITTLTSMPAPFYIPYFLPTSQYGANLSYPPNVYLQRPNGSRTLIIYNKQAGTQHDGNMLRIELRLTRVGQHISTTNTAILAEDLTSPLFFANLAVLLQDTINEHLAKRAIDLPKFAISNVNDLKTYALQRALSDPEERLALMRVIETRYKAKEIPEGNITRLRKELRFASDAFDVAAIEDLMDLRFDAVHNAIKPILLGINDELTRAKQPLLINTSIGDL
jgi:hypothetical protein